MKKSAQRHKSYFRTLVGSTLAAGSLFQLALPVLAETVLAGTSISNTATATYETPGGTQLNTKSNTVVITVAEVAGVNLTSNGVDNITAPGGVFQPGEKVDFKFLLTNTGNDPSQFVIPKPAVLNGDPSRVQNATVNNITYEVLNPDGTINSAKTPTNNDVGSLAGANDGALTVSLDPGEQIRIHVISTISPTAASGNEVKVLLGKTTGNADDTDTNPNTGQSRVGNTDANDIYTSDNANGSVTGEIAGAPVNGVQEAQAEGKLTVNQLLKQPFVKIDKTNSNYNTNGTLSNATDDTLDYTLKVTVSPNIPAGVTTIANDADDLYPTYVKGLSDGTAAKNYVLVSDVLPTGTQLNADPVAPNANWKVVYSTDNPTATTTGYRATWSLYQNGTTDKTTVKQVGFIYDPSGATTAAARALKKSSTAYGDFKFTIKTVVATPGAQIANIAQVFGETSSVTPSDTTKPAVYDESGDTSYNNDSNNDGNPDYPVDDVQADGIADPVTDGTDTNNNNSGTGTGGEDNVITLASPAGSVLNGTVDPDSGTLYPGAQGPTSLNDDFTNSAAPLTANTVGAATFSNSLSYLNGTANGESANLTLALGDLSDLPAGATVITLQYDPGNGNPVQTVVYTVNKSSDTATPVISLTSGTPIVIPVTEGTPDKYSVTVDLPDDASLVNGYDVPIITFIDTNNDKKPDTGEAQNTTIDRIYTGYVKLVKKTQILDKNGTPVSGPRGQLDTNPKSVAPGERIKYAVEYQNISEALSTGATAPFATSTGADATEPRSMNITLDAKNLVITEDGTKDGNNWATDLNGDGTVDTLHVISQALDTNSKPITYDGAVNDTGLDKTNVKIYKDTIDTLAPQASGTFSFQRVFQ